jgi:hypothetical protein
MSRYKTLRIWDLRNTSTHARTHNYTTYKFVRKGQADAFYNGRNFVEWVRTILVVLLPNIAFKHLVLVLCFWKVTSLARIWYVLVWYISWFSSVTPGEYWAARLNPTPRFPTEASLDAISFQINFWEYSLIYITAVFFHILSNSSFTVIIQFYGVICAVEWCWTRNESITFLCVFLCVAFGIYTGRQGLRTIMYKTVVRIRLVITVYFLFRFLKRALCVYVCVLLIIFQLNDKFLWPMLDVKSIAK